MNSRINEFRKGRTTMKTSTQRNDYLNLKMKQLDKVKDARKHTKRLARIMKYHELLTKVEVADMRRKLKQVFK